MYVLRRGQGESVRSRECTAQCPLFFLVMDLPDALLPKQNMKGLHKKIYESDLFVRDSGEIINDRSSATRLSEEFDSTIVTCDCLLSVGRGSKCGENGRRRYKRRSRIDYILCV